MLQVDVPAKMDIPWEALESVVKGISALDIHQMTITTLEEAERFILHYGYDFTNDQDREELLNVQQEAVSFIQRRFLSTETPWQDYGEETLNLTLPDNIAKEPDTRELLLKASIGNGLEQRWACAVLKVMHTISHINNAILFQYFAHAKTQILSRYSHALSHTPQGEVVLGHPSEGMQLHLAGFEMKDEKSRDSMILKLLCKRENVAEEVFDMIGIRIITQTKAETLLALEILRRNKLIIFPNIIPSRSRNSLIDFDEFKVQYQDALEAYEWGQTSLKDMVQLISAISTDPTPDSFNPDNSSSLASYRSIHITERQLIRMKTADSGREIRFFFPYELQLVDQASFLENSSGSSAHSLYKQNQLIQARRRVLGPLFVSLRKMNRHGSKNLEAEPTA